MKIMRDLLEKLLEQTRDKRYSPFVEEQRTAGKHAVNDYLSGKLKPEAEVTVGNFKSVILSNRRELYVNLQLPQKPVPSGLWMGFWDPDLQEVVGLDEKKYNQLSTEKQMEADATVQATKYAPHQFWGMFASAYHPEEYDRWWWNEGGSRMALDQGWDVVEMYWKKRFSGGKE